MGGGVLPCSGIMAGNMLRRHGATSMTTLCHSDKQVKNGGQ